MSGQLRYRLKRGKSIPVVEIVNHVGGIEQLGDGEVDVLLRLLQSILVGGGLGIIMKVEFAILSAIWSVIGNIGVPTLPIFMGEDVVAPGIGSIADRITMHEALIGRLWIMSNGQGVPAQRTGEFVVVLRLNSAVAFTWIVNAPLEDVIGRKTIALPGNRCVGIGGPVDDGDYLVRRVGRNSSLIPIVLHLDLELPNQIEVGGVTVRDLDIGQTSLDRVNCLGNVVDELHGDMGFAANKVAVHVGGHAIDIFVVFGKDLGDHIGVGSGSDHELKKCVTRIF